MMLTKKYVQFDTEKPPPLIRSVRSLLAILMFFCLAIKLAEKSELSIAVVCMVNHTAFEHNKTENTSSYTILDNYKSSGKRCLFNVTGSKKDPDGPFVWSKARQEQIMSVGSIGSLLCQIPSGWLVFRIGGRNSLAFSLFSSALVNLITPLCAQISYYLFLLTRLLFGFLSSFLVVAIISLWANWAPKNERSFLLGIGAAGSQIGPTIGFSLGSYLCFNGFDGGWPSIFYYSGAAGVVWSVLFVLLITESPETHKFISEREKLYIITETAESRKSKHQTKSLFKSAPWKSILRSRTCWCLYTASFATDWLVILYLSNGPIYMKEVLKFDIQSDGLLALPYISGTIIVLITGYVSDILIKEYKIKIGTVRKIFNSIGFAVPAIMMICLAHVECDHPYLALVFLTMGLGMHTCATGAGYTISFLEISGQYSPIVFGISATIASSTGFIVPFIIGQMTKNKTQEEWTIVFYVTATIYLLGGLPAIIFVNSKTEDWAKEKTIDDKLENEDDIISGIN